MGLCAHSGRPKIITIFIVMRMLNLCRMYAAVHYKKWTRTKRTMCVLKMSLFSCSIMFGGKYVNTSNASVFGGNLSNNLRIILISDRLRIKQCRAIDYL